MPNSNFQLRISDTEYNSKDAEPLKYSYQGDDIQIGSNSSFLFEILSKVDSLEVSLEISLPIGTLILTSLDGIEESGASFYAYYTEDAQYLE